MNPKNTFPIVFINAPSISSSKVELPGDPVSILYASRILLKSLKDSTFRSDNIPEVVTPNGRPVYDPRIWNEQSKAEFTDFISKSRPKIAFFCAYSPAHPYALEMAKEVKKISPDTLVVFGGKHQDETLSFDPILQEYKLGRYNTMKLIADGKAPPVVDIAVSGEGEYPIQFITEEVAKSLSLEGRLDVAEFLKQLGSKQDSIKNLGGRSVLASFLNGQVNLASTSYQPNSLLDFGSPYNFFPVATRNPIFLRPDGTPKITTNIVTLRGCKNSCIYCSESVLLNRDGLSRGALVDKTLERVLEDVSLGSEAAFFDDSVFFRGNIKSIQEFATNLAALQEKARKSPNDEFSKRLGNFEYAIQLCVEDVVQASDPAKILGALQDLKKSGCSYVYTGIESLDDQVMRNVQKFKQNSQGIYQGWFQKVDAALGLFKQAGLRVGASLLFGIPGETPDTIRNTFALSRKLLSEGKLYLVSPNLCSYHPGTRLTELHDQEGSLDYVSIPVSKDDLLLFFEEASENHLSKVLTRPMIEQINSELPTLANLNSHTIQDSLNDKK